MNRGASRSGFFRAMAVALTIAPPAHAVDPQGSEPKQAATADPSDNKDSGETPKMAEPQPEAWRRERFALTKGKTRIEIHGYAQEDFRHFGWQVQGDPAGKKQARQIELRRIRFGSRARFGNLLLEGSLEPRRLPTGSRLKSLSASYSFSKRLVVRAGFFKLPGGREFTALTNGTDFVDRSMIATRLVPERDWGITATGALGRVDYQVGGFRGDGSTSFRRTGATGAIRLAMEIAKGLELSGSLVEGRLRAAPVEGGAASSPQGASGQTASGFLFWSRPDVNGPRRRVSTALAYTSGPFRFVGEYQEEREARAGLGPNGVDLPRVLGHGWSAQASYLLTGEKKGVSVAPRTSVFRGGTGAIELVARAEALEFQAAGLSPAGVSAIEAGVNYWASTFVKVQTTAIWENYHEPKAAPVPGDRGRYFSLLARVQLMIP